MYTGRTSRWKFVPRRAERWKKSFCRKGKKIKISKTFRFWSPFLKPWSDVYWRSINKVINLDVRNQFRSFGILGVLWSAVKIKINLPPQQTRHQIPERWLSCMHAALYMCQIVLGWIYKQSGTSSGGASCAEPGGPSARSSGCRPHTWRVWPRCACGSVWWARLIGQSASRSSPTCSGTVSHLEEKRERRMGHQHAAGC